MGPDYNGERAWRPIRKWQPEEGQNHPFRKNFDHFHRIFQGIRCRIQKGEHSASITYEELSTYSDYFSQMYEIQHVQIPEIQLLELDRGIQRIGEQFPGSLESLSALQAPEVTWDTPIWRIDPSKVPPPFSSVPLEMLALPETTWVWLCEYESAARKANRLREDLRQARNAAEQDLKYPSIGCVGLVIAVTWLALAGALQVQSFFDVIFWLGLAMLAGALVTTLHLRRHSRLSRQIEEKFGQPCDAAIKSKCALLNAVQNDFEIANTGIVWPLDFKEENGGSEFEERLRWWFAIQCKDASSGEDSSTS
jgi:hypothetical protein